MAIENLHLNLAYFQYFSIQRQQFSLMQMSQMQGNPPMMHPHPIPVQPPSQAQVIHGFAEPTDVSPPVHNIHNDQVKTLVLLLYLYSY